MVLRLYSPNNLTLQKYPSVRHSLPKEEEKALLISLPASMAVHPVPRPAMNPGQARKTTSLLLRETIWHQCVNLCVLTNLLDDS